MPTTRPRYFPNDGNPLGRVENPEKYLIESLTIILQGCPPSMPWKGSFKDQTYSGLFLGPTSIAYLFMWLAERRPDLVVEGKNPADWCTAYLQLGQESVQPLLEIDCGITNEYLTYNTLMACHTKDEKYAKIVLDTLGALETKASECEWMKGRAGALYYLRILAKWLPHMLPNVQRVQKILINEMLAQDPWIWEEKHYIGAVHGDIGILTQIILTDSERAPELEPKLAWILDLQQEGGNWPVVEGKDIGLIQFCHGAPGVVFSLLILKPFFPNLHARIDIAIERARKLIWEKGLLTKEPNLCHGIIGNALALEDVQRDHFLSLATPERIRVGISDGTFEKDWDPFSMLWGEAGRARVWLDMLDGGRHGVPLYTDV